MKLLLPLLIFALLSAAPAAEKVVFDRPLKPGAVYDCTIRSEQSSRYAFQMPGADNPVVKLDTVSVFLAARLTVTAVNPVGNPSGIRLEIHSFSGMLNGVPVATKQLLKQTVAGDLSKNPVVFSCGKVPVSKEAAALLSAVFRPVSDSRLSDMTGAVRELKEKGDSWAPSVDALCKTLAARKLSVTPRDLSGEIVYTGNSELNRIPCRQFRIHIGTGQRADYDFRFKATLLLPVDPAAGPALKVTRDATEIVKRTVPRDNPFASGADVELISKDSTEVILLPASAASPASGRSGDNAWDAVLR